MRGRGGDARLVNGTARCPDVHQRPLWRWTRDAGRCHIEIGNGGGTGMPLIITGRNLAAGRGWRIASTGDPSRPYEIRASGWASGRTGADPRARRKVMRGAGRGDPACARALAFLADWCPRELESMRVGVEAPGWLRALPRVAGRIAVTAFALASVSLLTALDGPGASTPTSIVVGVACALVVGAWSSLARAWIPPRRPTDAGHRPGTHDTGQNLLPDGTGPWEFRDRPVAGLPGHDGEGMSA